MISLSILLIILNFILVMFWVFRKLRRVPDFKRNALEKFKNNILQLGLLGALILLLLYLCSAGFRNFLASQNIDPNFIIGFFTIVALFLSLIQSSKDKRYTYNMKLIESMEEKGLAVIAKLIKIISKSHTYLEGVKMYKQALGTKVFYQDTNNALSKEDMEQGMDLVAAYLDTYFPEQNQKWNQVQDELSELGTNYANVSINYDKNIEVLEDPNFQNKILDNIDQILIESEKNLSEIEKITGEIRNGILDKINNTKGQVKKSF